jgi:hypothetical protein
MPTIRCEYTIEQFEEVLQRLAHSFPRFEVVRTDGWNLTFHYDDEGRIRNISVRRSKVIGKNKWGYDRFEDTQFTVEPKLYADSPHSTKITFPGWDKEEQKRVMALINEIMGSVKPEPRFSPEEFLRRTENAKMPKIKGRSPRKRYSLS